MAAGSGGGGEGRGEGILTLESEMMLELVTRRLLRLGRTEDSGRQVSLLRPATPTLKQFSRQMLSEVQSSFEGLEAQCDGSIPFCDIVHIIY